jgi:hypothetical protein
MIKSMFFPLGIACPIVKIAGGRGDWLVRIGFSSTRFFRTHNLRFGLRASSVKSNDSLAHLTAHYVAAVVRFIAGQSERFKIPVRFGDIKSVLSHFLKRVFTSGIRKKTTSVFDSTRWKNVRE